MRGDFTDFHDQLRAVARDLLGKGPAEWRLLADSGWLGLEVPEALGGAGATFAEVAVIVEEMGRAATSSPYLGSVVLGVGALDLVEPSAGRDELLGDVASGSRRVAVVLASDEDAAGSAAPPFRLEPSPGGLRLHGKASFIPDAPDADRLLLVALDPEGDAVLVDMDPSAVGVTAQPVLDATRRFGVVTADGVEVTEPSVWRFTGDGPRRLLERAAVAIAGDSLGLSEAMLDATVTYAGVRQQFGRPIGSFQAVKHACADMLVEVSVSRELLGAAVEAVATDAGDAPVAVAMAKSHACGAAVDIVGKAMQLHGGIGYTWESGVHVYLKRAALNRSLFGSPSAHRRRLAGRFLAD